MTSHYHHHYHPTTAAAAPSPAPAPAPTCYSHCCCATFSPCRHHHPPPLSPPDPHLHHPPHQPHLYSPLSHLPNLPQYPNHFQEHYFQEERQPHPTVSSLLRRIAALESALRRRSSHTSSFHSLRDAAARTIQAHFRAYLLRRSITLRQLKELASIKSAVGVLKSWISEKTHFDYEVIYHKVVNLLLKLDAIQGGDPMIRNGKSSLSRELNKLLAFLEGVCVKRRIVSSEVNVRRGLNNVKSRVSNSERKIGNVKSGCLKRVNVEKLRGLVARIDRLAEELDEEQDEVITNPNNDIMVKKHDVSATRLRGLLKQRGVVQPKVKKNVTFAENGKVYRVLRRRSEPYLEEYCHDGIDMEDSIDDEKELEDDLCREIEEIGVSTKEEDVEEEAEEGSLLSGDGEEDSRQCSTSECKSERMRRDEDDIDNFIFSAPLPVIMENRGDSIDRRKKLNII